jgi:hypothetical protein
MNMVLLERLGTDFTLHEVSAFPERSFGSSSKLTTKALESQAIDGLDWRLDSNQKPARVLGVVVGVAGLATLGTSIYNIITASKKDKHQRDLS